VKSTWKFSTEQGLEEVRGGVSQSTFVTSFFSFFLFFSSFFSPN
jgi:hypothetical protein